MSSYEALQQQQKEEEIRLRLQALQYREKREQEKELLQTHLRPQGSPSPSPSLPLTSAAASHVPLSTAVGMVGAYQGPLRDAPPSYASISADSVPYGHPSLARNALYASERSTAVASSLPTHIAAERDSLLLSSGTLQRQRTTDIEVEATLLPLGLVRFEIPPDGACMFRAISHQLYGTGTRHQQVREAAVRKILELRDYFEPFMDYSGSGGAAMDGSRARTLPRYCKNMLQPDAWGGNVELQALAFAFDVQILIYAARAEVVRVGDDRDEEHTFRLWYSHGNHYDCVFTDTRYKNLKFCQAIVADLASMLFSDTYDAGAVIPFRNYDMEYYRQQQDRQADEDSMVAFAVSSEQSAENAPTTEAEDMALALALARQEEEEEEERRRVARIRREQEVLEQKELAQTYGPAYWEQRKAEEYYRAQKNKASTEKEDNSKTGGKKTGEKKGSTSPRGITTGLKLPKFFKRGKKQTKKEQRQQDQLGRAPARDHDTDMIDVYLD